MRIGSFGLAMRHALIAEGMDSNTATDIVADVVFIAIRPVRDLLARIARLRSRDRLRRVLWMSNLARRWYYAPPDWEMADVAVPGGFGMDVTRCVVAELFGSLGESEFCRRVLCDQDVRDAAHRGIAFERTGTLAGGADHCDFRYVVAEGGEPGQDRSGRELRDSVLIDSAPEPIWEWLSDLPSHYLQWHPDHVCAEWERGGPGRVGSVMRAVEVLGGSREVLRFELTEVDPPHRLDYRIRGPVSLLLPGGAFSVEPANGSSRVTASVTYRFGALTERLFADRMTAMKEHMRQEGENLKRLIEANG